MNWFSIVIPFMLTAGSYFFTFDDMITLPVHVHLFKGNAESLDMRLSKPNVRRWIEASDRRIKSVTELSPFSNQQLLSSETENVYENRLYTPIGSIWKQAKIQFRLVTYNVIIHDELEKQVVSANPFEFLPAGVHENYKMKIGVHVYIGRNAKDYGKNGGIFSGMTRGPVCTNSTNRNHAIALAWDTANKNGNTLAHEIGHFLGLQHPDEPFFPTCGIELLNASDRVTDNLMFSNGSLKANLTKKQITRAREMACRYLNDWGLGSSVCDSIRL